MPQGSKGAQRDNFFPHIVQHSPFHSIITFIFNRSQFFFSSPLPCLPRIHPLKRRRERQMRKKISRLIRCDWKHPTLAVKWCTLHGGSMFLRPSRSFGVTAALYEKMLQQNLKVFSFLSILPISVCFSLSFTSILAAL